MKNIVFRSIHVLFTAIVLISLVGVNVRQLYCMHQEKLVWEICTVMTDKYGCGDCCSQDGCEGNCCERRGEAGYFRITDCLDTEPEIQLEAGFPLSAGHCPLLQNPALLGNVHLPARLDEVSFFESGPDFLCVFRC